MARISEKDQAGAVIRDRSSLKSTIELVTAVVGLLTAIVAGIFGYNRNQAANQSSSQATILRQQLAHANIQIKRLNAKSGPTAAPLNGIWHQGQLVLNSGQSADLDAPPSDPHWGVLTGNPSPGTGFDITWDSANGLERPGWAFSVQLVLIKTSSASPRSSLCANAQGYSASVPVATDKIVQGASICIYTGAQRYSLLQVPSVKPDYSSVAFEVATFKNAND